MPHSLPRQSFVEVARRWLVLAEQRRAHLVELYESGRWRHYYTEAELRERTREAIMLEETWAKLAYPDGMPAAAATAPEAAAPEPDRPTIAPSVSEPRTRLARMRRGG